MASAQYQTRGLGQPPITLSRPSTVTPWKSVNPRLTSIEHYPALPSHPRDSAFCPGYRLTTHVFPAAFPRVPSYPWVPPVAGKYASRQDAAHEIERLAAFKEAQEECRDARPSRREVLWTVANRYVRTTPSRTRGLTLLMLHCYGGHKETWEPTLHSLFAALDESDAPFHVEEVWALDGVQHGDGSVVNHDRLGDTFDAGDYSRDATNFLFSYLPEEAHSDLPTNLPRFPESVAERRRLAGFSKRTLVGVGHSMGVAALVYPAVQHSTLFSSLVCIECMGIPEYIKYKDAHCKFETACMRRCWTWPTKADAVKEITSSRYFNGWGRRVFDVFFDHAMVTAPDGSVSLKLHPCLEATVILERRVVYESWELIEQIDPRIALHWVFGGRSERTGDREVQAQTAWRRPQNCSNDYHSNVGHLLAQQIPDQLAADIYRFLERQYSKRIVGKL